MFRPKLFIGFFLRFLLFFVVFMLPWPGLGEGYGAIFRAGANAMFGAFGSRGRVRFLERAGDREHDMLIVLRNRDTGAGGESTGSTRLQGYKPTVFLAALILSTPIPWRRRWRALAWSLLWINLYVAFRIFIFLVSSFSGAGDLSLYTLGPIRQSCLDLARWVFVDSFAGWVVVPVPIWFLLTFGRCDLSAILQGRSSSA